MSDKGYTLPENIDPEALRCFKVYVPDDTLYIAAFWSAYQFFGTWLAWERDPLNRGAEAAAVWRDAFSIARAQFEAGEGCDVIFRQNPANPCQLQQSHDGGETWTLAFDYSLCSTVITVPAPYPGSGTGASDAAAAAARNVFEGLLEVAEDICALTRAEYINQATAYMRTYDAEYANPAALGAIYDAYCALSPEEQDNAKTDCPYEQKKDELENCADADGLFDYLNCLSELLSDWLDETSTALMEALNQAAAALSGNGWQRAAEGGEGGGAGFGATCEWCMELTPAAFLGTYFEPYDGGIVYTRATWHAGEGWGEGPAGQEPKLIQLMTTCADQNFHITTVTLEGDGAGTEEMQFRMPNAGGGGTDLGYTGGAAIHTFVVNADTGGGMWISYKPGSAGTSADKLTKVTICGTGPQPEWECA